MTPPSLTSLRAALQAATPGPWEHRTHEGLHAIACPGGWLLEGERDDGPDAAAIVLMRNAMPLLLEIAQYAIDMNAPSNNLFACLDRRPCGVCRCCRMRSALAALEGSDGE